MIEKRKVCGYGTDCNCITADDCAMAMGKSLEPKANPSKELYSIKSLEWRESFDDEIAESGFGTYVVSKRGKWYCKCYLSGESADTIINDNCESIEDGKRQAQTHFESKLKQMLNREI